MSHDQANEGFARAMARGDAGMRPVPEREWRVITSWNSGGESVYEGLARAAADDMAFGHREHGHSSRVESRDATPWRR